MYDGMLGFYCTSSALCKQPSRHQSLNDNGLQLDQGHICAVRGNKWHESKEGRALGDGRRRGDGVFTLPLWTTGWSTAVFKNTLLTWGSFSPTREVEFTLI